MKAERTSLLEELSNLKTDGSCPGSVPDESCMTSGPAVSGAGSASPMQGLIHVGISSLTDGCYALHGPGRGNVAHVDSVLAQIEVRESRC